MKQTEKEISKILNEKGFEVESYSPEGDAYLDFKKSITKGFGTKGDDRVETLTIVKPELVCYASVGHRDEDGNYWYEDSSNQTFDNVDDCLAWLDKNRKTAPVDEEKAKLYFQNKKA